MTVPGFWADAVYTPAGFRFVVQAIGSYDVSILDEQGKQVWRFPSPEGFWFLRAAALPDGTIGIVGQGHQHPGMQFMIVRPDGTNQMLQFADPHVWAQNGVIIRADGNDAWKCAVQFAPREWRYTWVSRDGTQTRGNASPLPLWPGGDGSSSQGFLYWNAQGEPVFTDPTRTVVTHGQAIMLSMLAENGVRVGQHPNANGILVVFPDGRKGIFEPNHTAFEPHIVSHGDLFAIASRSLNGLSIIGVLPPDSSLNPLPGPVTPPPPPPPPPPTPPTGVPAVKLSTAAKEVIVKFAAKFPLATNDEASREWTHKLAQQLKFSLPADGWGHKSAGVGRPHSADCIAIERPFIGWDVISGGGAPGATLALENDSIDLSGQVFEPVDAVDHIGVPPTPPPGPTPPPAGSVDVEILAELKKQTVILTAVAQGLQALPSQLDASIGALKASFDKGVKIRF